MESTPMIKHTYMVKPFGSDKEMFQNNVTTDTQFCCCHSDTFSFQSRDHIEPIASTYEKLSLWL